jgi:hypothetical protein
MVGVETGRRGEAPCGCEGFHLHFETGVLGDHLVGEGFDRGICGLGLGEFAQLDLIEVGLRRHGQELLALVSHGCTGLRGAAGDGADDCKTEEDGGGVRYFQFHCCLLWLLMASFALLRQ